MTVIALTSLRGAPGVTTLAVAAAAVWPTGRRVRIVEGDPAGGVLATRYRLSETTGTGTLAASVRRHSRPQVLEEHSQVLPGGDVPVVVAPTAADHAATSIGVIARRAATLFSRDDATDTLIDCGRMFVGSPARPLFDNADVAVVVATSEADALTGLRQARSWLADATGNLRVVTVGGHPYGPQESAAFLQLPVFVVASDARAAAAMAGHRRAKSLQRSSLVRSVRSLIGELLDPRPAPRPDAASIPSPVAP